ncbi:hypothetical protein ACFV20_37180, partial [Streptomyces sp. NPDC059696]
MDASHFQRFLIEATTEDPDPTNGLVEEQLYGLYISWCLLNGRTPKPETDFHVAMKEHHVDLHRLGITGPAATDYILHSS